MNKKNNNSKKKGKIIFRASLTLKDGTKVYAKDYGLKGFPIIIKKE